jgi:dephospho-CoA kinase
MIIIGITGRARSGKDELFNAIQNGLEKPWPLSTEVQRFAFADALKDEVQKVFIDCPKSEEEKEIWRPLWQHWGMTRRRVFGEDYWVEKLFRWIDKCNFTTSVAVITDVRFLNEAKAIKDRGGIIVRIIRPQRKTIWETIIGLFQMGNDHISETEMDKIDADMVVLNDGTKEELYAKAQQIALAVVELQAQQR